MLSGEFASTLNLGPSCTPPRYLPTMTYPAYYTDFWTRFRAMNPDLPTGSGWKRKPTDLHANYDGARSPRWNNVYCHVGFVGSGLLRRLVVEWYESDRQLAEWVEFLHSVQNVTPPAALVVENEPPDKIFERRRAYLTGQLTMDDMVARREVLLRQASDAYRVLVVHL